MSVRPVQGIADEDKTSIDGTTVPDKSLRTSNVVARRLQSSAPTSSSASWSRILFSANVAEVALDAVRYKKNYDRGVSSRLCLHYVNTVRTRVVSDITYYLLSVDGCESSDVTPSGRCDIYYCTPYTYELKLRQKAVDSSLFMVESIYKELSQKAQSEIAAETSNLDFTAFDDYDSDGSTPTAAPASTTPAATSSAALRSQVTQLEAHTTQSSFSLSNDIPQRFRSFMSAGNSTTMMLASVGFVFGIAVALVVARVRTSRARALELRRQEFRRRHTTCYTPLQPESS